MSALGHLLDGCPAARTAGGFTWDVEPAIDDVVTVDVITGEEAPQLGLPSLLPDALAESPTRFRAPAGAYLPHDRDGLRVVRSSEDLLFHVDWARHEVRVRRDDPAEPGVDALVAARVRSFGAAGDGMPTVAVDDPAFSKYLSYAERYVDTVDPLVITAGWQRRGSVWLGGTMRGRLEVTFAVAFPVRPTTRGWIDLVLRYGGFSVLGRSDAGAVEVEVWLDPPTR